MKIAVGVLALAAAAVGVGATVPTQGQPSFSADQVARGAEVFVTQCAQCHGSAGEDVVDVGPELSGDNFWKTWSGRPARALYSRIISTMPASEPGILDPQDALDVTLYLGGIVPDEKARKRVTNPDALNIIRLADPTATP